MGFQTKFGFTLTRNSPCPDCKRLTARLRDAPILSGVTEYSDPPENPGISPDFTENVGPLH